MTGKKAISYSEAIQKIEEILEQIEEGNMEIDQLGESLKEVSNLIQLCKSKISKTEKEINNILQNIETQEEG